jgi:hypothetical protein
MKIGRGRALKNLSEALGHASNPPVFSLHSIGDINTS